MWHFSDNAGQKYTDEMHFCFIATWIKWVVFHWLLSNVQKSNMRPDSFGLKLFSVCSKVVPALHSSSAAAAWPRPSLCKQPALIPFYPCTPPETKPASPKSSAPCEQGEKRQQCGNEKAAATTSKAAPSVALKQRAADTCTRTPFPTS